MADTAIRLGTTTRELASMTNVKQMDYVEKYFEPFSGDLKTIEDVYMVIFCPKAVGQKDDYVLYSSGRNSYTRNKGLGAETGRHQLEI